MIKFVMATSALVMLAGCGSEAAQAGRGRKAQDDGRGRI